MNIYRKYKNKKVQMDGYTFASKKEAERYKVLSLMQKSGEIKNLIIQPSFLLQNGFDFNGKKERAITYIADFEYIHKGKKIIEDCKGFRTEVYKIKRKLLLNKLPKDTIFLES